MFAIIRVGGKQYRVENGTQILVDRLHVEEGSAVEGVEVLMLAQGDDIQIGAPTLEIPVGVTALRHQMGKKIRVFKYKAKKNYRRRIGSRPHQTLIRVDSINGNSERANTRAAKAATPATPDVAAAPAATETVAPAPVEAAPVATAVETAPAPTTEVVQAVVETSSEKSAVEAIQDVPGVESVEVVEDSEQSA